ncbi:MAG TPA: ABC transporter permease [Micromonosporaceae bacterium]|nr:ABC transporter permease [Micromonosporaceae bacterium]
MVSTTSVGPEAGLSGAELATRYGLAVAGARPGIVTYTRQLWSYRNFIVTYASSIISASFSKARLGRLWQVLTPLSNAAVYYLIFGVVIGTSRGVPNFITYLCVGVFTFLFTSSSAVQGVQSVTKNLAMIRALHFPRATVSLATTWTQLQNFLAALVVLICIALATHEPISRTWVYIPPCIALQLMFNTGLGFVCARIGAKIPDLKQLAPFVTRTWMYMSGVLYSATKFDANLPGPLATVAKLNPAVVYIDIMRHALLRRHANSPSYAWVWPPMVTWGLAVGWAVVALALGYIYFWRGEEEYGRG